MYISCGLGSGIIRKAYFLFGCKYKEYKDIEILYSSVFNVSMLQWYTYKVWTVMKLCLFNNGLLCSFFIVFFAKYLMKIHRHQDSFHQLLNDTNGLQVPLLDSFHAYAVVSPTKVIQNYNWGIKIFEKLYMDSKSKYKFSKIHCSNHL